jgi:hypothetical protein
MDDQTATGLFDLASFQQIQPARPVLHYPAALFDVFGMVVGRANGVRVAVRELRPNPRRRVADLVERRREARPYAVPR